MNNMTLSERLKKELDKDLPTEENLNEWEMRLYFNQSNNKKRQA